MPRLPSIGSFCWKLCCGGVSCLNLVLAGIALLQSAIILFNAIGRSVPLPNAIPALVVAKILPDDLSLKWTKAYFDLGGGCLLQGVEIHHRQSGERLFSAEVVRLNLALPQLLLQRGPPLEEIETTVATLYIPAPISASGTNQPLLVIHEARLSLRGDQLQLHRVLAQAGQASLVLHGALPMDRIKGASGDRPSVDFSGLAKLEQQLLQLDQTQAMARLYAEESPDQPISVTLYASGRHHGIATTGDINYRLRGQVQLHQTTDIRLQSLDGFLSMATPPALPPPVVSSLGPLQGPVQVRLRTFRRDLSDAAPTFAVRLLEPFGNDGRLSSIELVTAFPFTDTLTWRASGRTLKASGEARLHRETSQQGLVALSGWVALDEGVLREWLPSIPQHRLLEGIGARSLETAFAWESTSRTARGTTTLRGLSLEEETIEELSLDWAATPKGLTVDRFSVDLSPQESISGTFGMELDSGRFSLATAGRIHPHSLDRFLGDWWKAIFQNIRVAQPVEAEVAIKGIFGDPPSLRSVVFATSRSAAYRDVPIPELRLMVRGNREWAFLESLHAAFGKASISGQLAWQQGLPDDVRRPMLLKFRSNAPWPIVLQASGIPGLAALDFSEPPKLALDGWIYRPPRANRSIGPLPQLVVDILLPDGVMRFEGLEFDQVVATATVRDRIIEVQPLSGGFADGIFTGSLLIHQTKAASARSSDLNLQLIDARFTESMEQLSRLLEDPAAFMNNFAKAGPAGRINADFSLHLAPERADWTSVGQLSIKNARLGQIHLLGGLSKILNSIGLGFTSLDIHSGHLQWTLANDSLVVPQSLLTGTLLGLRLEGSLFLPTNELDMRADLNLFQGLVSKVLTPVSDNIQLDLKGTLREPRWSIRLSPLRWFTNRLTEGLSPPP